MQDPVFISGIMLMPCLCWSCSRDATAVRITYTYRGGSRELIIALVYLPYDSDEPPPAKEMRDIIDYCFSRKKQLTIGYDANTHHILWESTGTNPRGESLMEFLITEHQKLDTVERSTPSKTEKETRNRGGTCNVETPASPA
ncbi:uncharacterized protein LOC111867116 isoform X2 [Cryptotermes secundus]|uniref:uncharacterized protein LOC111867116 isoform X2 n=1 Tax=Cryptotermes secundus TaxID=105785 RepID=UPI000CD7B292|nr:uncharacterized protein LOC111867116 isoform X2 [Cryptotermes secundus]